MGSKNISGYADPPQIPSAKRKCNHLAIMYSLSFYSSLLNFLMHRLGFILPMVFCTSYPAFLVFACKARHLSPKQHLNNKTALDKNDNINKLPLTL